MNKFTTLAVALGLATAGAPALAQHAGHRQPQAQQPTPRTAPPKHQQTQADHSQMDHSQMDHSQMGHGQLHGDHEPDLPADALPREPIPVVTEADRAAAFPDVHEHHVHGTSIHRFTLIDRLEVSDANPGTQWGWEALGWIGGDIHKFMWRTEGHARDGSIHRGNIEALYGRGVRPWWDVVAGVRHDFGEGPSRTWVGVGVQGVAPYKFEVSATGYVGQQGQTLLVGEAEYDTLLTNRLILQWRAEGTAYGKDDPVLGIGSGLSTIEAGARLRYEVTRQFAPYVGIERERAFGRTAQFRRAVGEAAGDTKVVAGMRIWF